jgi:hypothetical protein
MNANEVYIGGTYAYTENPTRGTMPRYCKKVRVKGKKSIPPGRGEVKATTMVTVEYIVDGALYNRQDEVNVRNLVCTWEHYEETIEGERREREEREARRLKEAQDMEESKKVFIQLLESLGLPVTDPAKVHVTHNRVSVQKEAFIEWIVTQSGKESEDIPLEQESSSGVTPTTNGLSMNPATGQPYFRY